MLTDVLTWDCTEYDLSVMGLRMKQTVITSAMRFRRLLYPLGALFAVFSAFGNQVPEAFPSALTPPTLRSGGTVKEMDLRPGFRDPDVTGSAVRVSVRLGTTVKTVDIALYDETQPITVTNFLAYVTSGRHNDNFFHRSVPGFVVQGGGFKWINATNVDSVPTYPKIQNEPGRSNVRGTVAMAKLGNDPNSATSQWFVNLADNSTNLDFQNGGFTVFGRVVGNGMAVIDEVAALPRYNAGGAFDSLPLKDFPGGQIERVHTIETSSAVIPALSFSAVSSDPSLLEVSVTGSTLRLTPSPNNFGTATVTVTATDLDGASIQSAFNIQVQPYLQWQTVAGENSEFAGIDLKSVTTPPATQEPVIVSMGNIKEGAAISRTFTVKNSSSSVLTGLSLSGSTQPSNDSEKEFVVSSPLGSTTLAPGASTTFSITFTPQAVGSRSATYNLTTADSDVSALTFSFSGVGVFVPPPALTPLIPQTLAASPTGFITMPDLRGTLVTATDPEGVTSFVQSPAPGTIMPLGTYPLSFNATNSFGKVSTVQTTLSVRFAAASTPEITLSGAEARTPVPTEGSAGLPSGSALAAFGTPAISDFRHLAARVVIKSGRASLAGIYLEDGAGENRLVAAQTQPAGVGNASFKSFQDPLLSPNGAIAFGVKLAGVKITEDEGVWTNLFGDLAPILREGATIPGVDGPKLKSVSSVSITDTVLFALVKLIRGVGGVTALSDTALVRITGPSSGAILAQVGTKFDGVLIKMLSVLQPAAGSAGQGRWHGANDIVAKLTLADRRTLLVRFNADGTSTKLLQSGAEDTGLGITLARLGLPSLGNPGIAVLATKPRGNGVTALNDDALFYAADGQTFAEVVHEGEIAEDTPTPVMFASFGDPVTNNQGEMLFLANLRGSSVRVGNQAGLWVKNGTNAPALIARLGKPVTDKNGDPVTNVVWSSFASYALPDGQDAGPVFLARMKGSGISAKNNLGLWGVDSSGAIRLLVQTYDEIILSSGTKRITGLTLLNSLPGSFGARRSYNSTGSLAVLATFIGGSQAILRIDIP